MNEATSNQASITIASQEVMDLEELSQKDQIKELNNLRAKKSKIETRVMIKFKRSPSQRNGRISPNLVISNSFSILDNTPSEKIEMETDNETNSSLIQKLKNTRFFLLKKLMISLILLA